MTPALVLFSFLSFFQALYLWQNQFNRAVKQTWTSFLEITWFPAFQQSPLWSFYYSTFAGCQFKMCLSCVFQRLWWLNQRKIWSLRTCSATDWVTWITPTSIGSTTQAPPNPSLHWLTHLNHWLETGKWFPLWTINSSRGVNTLSSLWVHLFRLVFLFFFSVRHGHRKQQWFVCSVFYLQGRKGRSGVDTRRWDCSLLPPLEKKTSICSHDIFTQILLEKPPRISDMLVGYIDRLWSELIETR